MSPGRVGPTTCRWPWRTSRRQSDVRAVVRPVRLQLALRRSGRGGPASAAWRSSPAARAGGGWGRRPQRLGGLYLRYLLGRRRPSGGPVWGPSSCAASRIAGVARRLPGGLGGHLQLPGPPVLREARVPPVWRTGRPPGGASGTTSSGSSWAPRAGDRVTDREQRLVFGEDAELYDKARPTYPPAVIDAVVAMAGPALGSVPWPCGGGGRRDRQGHGGGGRAGARDDRGGTRPGHGGGAPAQRRRLPRCPGRVERLRGRGSPGRGPYDLVYCAQAWHWVDPAVRYARAAASAPRRGRPGALLAPHPLGRRRPVARTSWTSSTAASPRELHAREPGFPGHRRPAPGRRDTGRRCRPVVRRPAHDGRAVARLVRHRRLHRPAAHAVGPSSGRPGHPRRPRAGRRRGGGGPRRAHRDPLRHLAVHRSAVRQR